MSSTIPDRNCTLICELCFPSEQRFFFFSSRRRHTRFDCDWSSDVCSSDLRRERPITRPNCEDKNLVGSVWTWIAIDADTKLVPMFHVGTRDAWCAWHFMQDLAARLRNRVQLTTDGHHAYLSAVGQTFGQDIDFAQLIKIYGTVPEGE